MSDRPVRSGGSRPRVIDRVFTVSVILKGVDGLLEIAGGLLFLSVDPRTLNAAVRFLTANEISEDPSDVVANALRRAAAHLTSDIAAFAAIYLVAHGLVKLMLVAGLLRRKHWAFPTALVVLGAFVVYQSYRFALGALAGDGGADGGGPGGHLGRVAGIPIGVHLATGGRHREAMSR